LLLEPLEGRWVPATLTPTTFADGGLGSGSLRDAVLQFNADTGTADDVIQLLPGTYSLTIGNVNGRHETAGLTGDLNLTQTSHRWIIQGAGPSTIIDASQLQDRVFEIVHPGTQVVFQDLVIQGGLAQDDGSDGALAGTTAALGGGIVNNGGYLTLDDVVLQNNVARGGDASRRTAPGYDANGGGIYSTGGAMTLAGATIANNQAMGGRGGDSSNYNYYAGNGGSASGAGLYASGGSLDISDSRIANNQATGGRGGDGGFTYLSGTFFLGGAGGVAQGGGLYVNGGSLTLASSTIASNQGTGGPAGVNGTLGYSAGGGVYIVSNVGTPTVTGSTLSGNSAGSGPGNFGYGGGIYTSGTLTVSNSTLSGNTASGGNFGNDGGYGGGIYNLGTLAVSNSTLSGNSATYLGGGIYNDGTLTVSNSTLSGNSASYGGGIYIYFFFFPNPVTLTNVTLTANRADVYGGGLMNVFDMTGLSNGVNGNQVGSASDPIDPRLGPLQDNGGPTQTMALLPSSPAIDVGDPAQLGTADQRGVSRTGGVNIGPYQASATAFILAAPGMVTSGVPFDMTVAAVDPFGQVAVGYTGTITFSTTDPDPRVVLPADYRFRPGDAGQVTFRGGVTLITPGDQLVSVADTADDTITGSALVTVSPAPGPGAPGPHQPPQAGTWPGGAAPPSAPSPGQVLAVDAWFASLNQTDAGFVLVPPLRHVRAETDGWALDPWWAGAPVLT
jgi:hypothetical protein